MERPRQWKDLREIRWEGVDWMHLAPDWDKWRLLVNMKLSGSTRVREFLD